MRKLKLEQPPSLERKDTGFVTQTRQYKLITPLFGGGVTPREADPVTIVRGAEVRGQLRFWWRATQGGRFGGKLKAMKAAEDELWGAASFVKKDRDPKQVARPVQIFISQAQSGRLDQPFVVEKGRVKPNNQSVVPAYAAFALQPTSEEAKTGGKSGAVRLDVAFELEISFPETKRSDVEAALWAWETFGGIGARTRRGFGALRCVGIWEDDFPQPLALAPAANQAAVTQWLTSQLERHIAAGAWPKNVPHLSPSMVVKIVPSPDNPLPAWKYLITALHRFRQSREGQFGATHWPEPNAIRQAEGKPVSSKSPHLDRKAPRAFFGLPIIFHFPQKGQPSDATLKGQDSERMASPLILKPLACGQTQAVGLGAILEGPPLPPGQLVFAEKKYAVAADLIPAEAHKIKPLRGQTDVLKAFLDTL